ncbi:MAG TPA: erythromycin esterase family protein [Trueperaceae bacterium]
MRTSLETGIVAHPVSLSPFECGEFDEALTGVRVVLLGEQSHGDGTAFSAKVELVRHLHVKHGFDVLAFESCFYSLNNVVEDHSGRDPVSCQVARQLYGHWRHAKELIPLWELLDERAKARQPLVVAGIDPRHSGIHVREHLVADLESLLSEHLPDELDTEAFARFRDLLEGVLEHEYRHMANALDRAYFLNTIWRLRRKLSQVDGVSFWQQELINLAYFARNAWSFEGRDQGMASNLLWLTRVRYPNSKIIVWTHDWHAAKCSSTIKDADAEYQETLEKHPDIPLGEVAAGAIGDELYSLTLIAGNGSELPNAYRGDYQTSRPLPPAPQDTLEALLLHSQAEAAFVNLREQPTQTFSISGLEPAKWLHLNWARVFDGVLFLREMKPLQENKRSETT